MSRCKTCRWWGKGDRDLPSARKCWFFSFIVPYPGPEYVQQDSFYIAPIGEHLGVVFLVFGPDFGCVHYEEKENV